MIDQEKIVQFGGEDSEMEVEHCSDYERDEK